MTNLFPALNFLYLYNSNVDLYLKRIREAVLTIPHGILRLEYNCLPIIMDYSDLEESENNGIVLGHGFHHSDFENVFSYPKEGLVFCLNQPYSTKIEKIRMHHTKHSEGITPINSSFMIGQNRFILTSEEFNLDEVVCHELNTGTRYQKP